LDEVKTDFVHQPGNLLANFEILDGIRMWSLKDAAGMKMNAIYSRGSKKDFWDLDELLNHFSLIEMIDWFLEKSPPCICRRTSVKLGKF
jgi:hypothetical protein